MKAAIYTRYGAPGVLRIAEVPTPRPAEGEILVKVSATSVTTADWRLRASAFPGATWLPGRLMTGLFAPKKPILGGDFAGTVAAVGAGVTGFAAGDRVFGFSGFGAHAEYLTIPADAAVAKLPARLAAEDAAAVPFGALAALVFLRDMAGLRAGQRVLIVGGTGGVGAYAIQIAKALGAHVTAVAGPGRAALMRDLGADETRDYTADDYLAGPARYDLVFETVGAISFAEARRVLHRDGLFLPLNFGLKDALRALLAPLRRGPRIRIGVNGDSRQDLEALRDMLAEGTLRPVVDRVYPLADIREAHAHVSRRHRQGAVVIHVAPEPPRASEAA